MEIEPHDDGYLWLDSYGRGRTRRRLNNVLRRGNVAWITGIGTGLTVGFILLSWLREVAR